MKRPAENKVIAPAENKTMAKVLILAGYRIEGYGESGDVVLLPQAFATQLEREGVVTILE